MLSLLRFVICLIGVLCALGVMPRTANATTIRRFTRSELEDLAAGSTHVVVGRFVRWEHQSAEKTVPISVTSLFGDVDLARIRVDEVLEGSDDILHREIFVIGRLSGDAGNGAVMFLRRERDRFWIVKNALFRTRGTDVDIATERQVGMPIAELAAQLDSVKQIRVTWTARIAERSHVGGVLPVVFIAKNAGDTMAAVRPPSQCASVRAYPLAEDGLFHAVQPAASGWAGGRVEPSVAIAPGAEEEFAYAIPLSNLNMDWPGRWDVVLGMTESFCNVPNDFPRALPNYMAERVIRVTIEGQSDGPAPPVHMASAPPAYTTVQPGGCAATNTSRSGAAARALAFLVATAVVVGIAVGRRRARSAGKADTF